MPEPMNPADVPEEWVRAYDDATAHCWGRPDHGIRLLDCCRRAGLAAVLPLHEQQVRDERDAYQRSLAEAHTSLAILLIREGGQTELTVAEQIKFPSNGTFITVHNPATGGTVLTYRYKGDGGQEADHA